MVQIIPNATSEDENNAMIIFSISYKPTSVNIGI